MRGNGLGYLIKEGLKYFWTNKVMSITSVSVLATCLLITGSFWLAYLNIDQNLKDISADNEIVVFLYQDADDVTVKSVGNRILEIGNVANSVFVSKEEGLEQYREQFPDQEELLADMENDNPLSDSYHITIKDLEQFDETVYQLEQIDGIEKINSRPDIAKKLVTIGQVVTFISIFVMALLLAVSLFILVNTIKLARFAYRKEINIMKYVGATDWFIRWPFIIDGAIMGILAGGIAFFAEKYLYLYLMDALKELSFIITMIPFVQLQGMVLLGFMGFGLSVGVIGSGITIRRYLDV